MRYDAFISYASEDKDPVAEPIARHLAGEAYAVWYAETALKVGDSLRRSIDRGLAAARFGVVILSPRFLAKNWPKYELDALVQKENASGEKVILPVWHLVSRSDVATYSPTLADRKAALTADGLPTVCKQLCEVLGSPISDANGARTQPVSDRLTMPRASLAKDHCPRCGKRGEIFGYEGGDGDEMHWFECPRCGYFVPI